MKKSVILLSFTLFLMHLALAQVANVNLAPASGTTQGNDLPKGNAQISGTILDESNNEPVPFTTVALLELTSEKPLDGTVADVTGKFTINKILQGKYILLINFMGFEPLKVPVEIVEKNASIDLGNIKISPTTQVLKEVTVEGQKDLFEEKVDRTVYNAENDITNKGGDASDVLRKVPMLSVDLDGNVTLRGSQNITVLINNRPSAITAGSVADALKQIPADMIKSVEVITSPSARYDAEGSGGIINIITKKNDLNGYSLGIDAGVGLRGSNLGLNGSLRNGKMGFSLGGFGRYGYNVNGSFENEQTTQSINDQNNVETITSYQYANTRNQFLFGRYQLGWDYDINKRNFVNASVQFGARNRNTFQDNLLTHSYRNNMLERTGIRDVNVADLSGTLDVNLNYTYTFKKPQQELSVLTQYSRNDRTNNFINNILNEENLLTINRLKNINESLNEETTVQLDYQNPIGKNQMVELGGKNISRQVSSDFQYFYAEGADGAFIPTANVMLGNIFNYNQNVTAGYISYTLTTANLYSFKLGTRYEYTTINAGFQQGEDVNIPAYGSMVPSINASKKLSNGNTIKAAYNRRLQRPSLQFLNPNLMASNPLDVTIGNPSLNPEFTDNFELGYNTMIKGTTLSFTGFMRNTNNSIQSVRDVIGDTIRTSFQNIGSENAYGVNIFANVNISNKLTLNGGTDLYYAVLNNNDPNPVYAAANEGMVLSFRLFGSYNLTKGWGIQGFSFFRGNQVQLQGSQGGFRMYSLGLKKDFNNKKGSIGFGAENFLSPSITIKSELNSPVILRNSITTMNNLSFRVNFSYRIGKMNDAAPRRRTRSVSNDDLKGGGGSDGDGQQATPATSPGPRRDMAPTQGQSPPASVKPEDKPDSEEKPDDTVKEGQEEKQAEKDKKETKDNEE
ncbi:MAG: TonB-dependent receptor [Bacteroidota bacterium]|nr:TonB-dependent receptor [Bacteroidota bacterium]